MRAARWMDVRAELEGPHPRRVRLPFHGRAAQVLLLAGARKAARRGYRARLPGVSRARIFAPASAGLEALELLARGRHIARALARHCRSDEDAMHVLVRSLGPEHATDELLGAGMAPFFYLPHTSSSRNMGSTTSTSRCERSTS